MKREVSPPHNTQCLWLCPLSHIIVHTQERPMHCTRAAFARVIIQEIFTNISYKKNPVFSPTLSISILIISKLYSKQSKPLWSLTARHCHFTTPDRPSCQEMKKRQRHPRDKRWRHALRKLDSIVTWRVYTHHSPQVWETTTAYRNVYRTGVTGGSIQLMLFTVASEATLASNCLK